MSWKSLVCASLICALASPVWAAPSLSLTNQGLNSDGHWVWNLSVSPDINLFTPGTPMGTGSSLAVELGLRATGSNLLSITPHPDPIVPPNADGTQAPGGGNVEAFNPGNVIFGWETLDPTANDQPVGIQINNNEAFLSLGTTIFTTAGPHQIATIVTEGPSTAVSARHPSGSLSSSLEVVGSFAGDSGRISQAGNNYNGIAGTATRTALTGDVDLNGEVNFTDITILSPNFGQSPRHWGQGDFDGNAEVNFTDITILSPFFGQSGGVDTPLNVTGTLAAGAGASLAAVPEPTSFALAGLALLAGLGMVRRRK